jgi:hypothetical protein
MTVIIAGMESAEAARVIGVVRGAGRARSGAKTPSFHHEPQVREHPQFKLNRLRERRDVRVKFAQRNEKDEITASRRTGGLHACSWPNNPQKN